LRAVAAAMQQHRIVIVPKVGHSINIEIQALYARFLEAWFGAG
jgi:non-heme chloroperoxidase